MTPVFCPHLLPALSWPETRPITFLDLRLLHPTCHGLSTTNPQTHSSSSSQSALAMSLARSNEFEPNKMTTDSIMHIPRSYLINYVQNKIKTGKRRPTTTTRRTPAIFSRLCRLKVNLSESVRLLELKNGRPGLRLSGSPTASSGC